MADRKVHTEKILSKRFIAGRKYRYKDQTVNTKIYKCYMDSYMRLRFSYEHKGFEYTVDSQGFDPESFEEVT